MAPHVTGGMASEAQRWGIRLAATSKNRRAAIEVPSWVGLASVDRAAIPDEDQHETGQRGGRPRLVRTPEPSTALLMGLGLVALGVRRRAYRETPECVS
jgi:hypothetical protein